MPGCCGRLLALDGQLEQRVGQCRVGVTKAGDVLGRGGASGWPRAAEAIAMKAAMSERLGSMADILCVILNQALAAWPVEVGRNRPEADPSSFCPSDHH